MFLGVGGWGEDGELWEWAARELKTMLREAPDASMVQLALEARAPFS